jgi:hypothetical protein
MEERGNDVVNKEYLAKGSPVVNEQSDE